MTASEALTHLQSGDPEEQLTALRVLVRLEVIPELYAICIANLSSSDDRVVFFSLDMLVKKYPLQLHNDAKLLINQLLRLLITGDIPVFDRATWALNVTGENSLHELVSCITKSTEQHATLRYIHALSRNSYLHRHPTLVVETLRAQLKSQSCRIQLAAADALLEMSPLAKDNFSDSPLQRSDMDAYDFKLVYAEVTEVYWQLMELHKEDHHWTSWIARQLHLLDNRGLSYR